MQKKLLLSTVALGAALFAAQGAVSAEEATTATASEANVQTLPTDVKVDKATEADKDSAKLLEEAKKADEAKKAEEAKKEAERKEEERVKRAMHDTSSTITINDIYAYLGDSAYMPKPAPEVKDIAVLGFDGKALKLDGKEVTVKATEGRQTVEFKSDRGIYKLEVTVANGKATLVKNPQLIGKITKVDDENKKPEETKPEVKDGWNKLENGKWQFIKEGKAVENSWIKDGGTWYFLDAAGEMQGAGWANIQGVWYFFNGSGAMQTGWVNDNGTWYYLNGSGAMVTGWVNDNGTWYFLKSNGAMATGWYQVGEKWYYSYNNGALAMNTTIGGYTVNASGEWVR